MSADAYADENGHVTLMITDYWDVRRYVTVMLEHLAPFGPVTIELLEGTDYLPTDRTKP